MPHIIQINCDHVHDMEPESLSDLQAKYSHDFHVGKALPDGVAVLSIEELLVELNETHPVMYFKQLLSRESVLK